MLGVVLGLIVALIVIVIVEVLGHVIYPLPAHVDVNNPESLKAYVANAPFGALLFVSLADAVSSFVGGWLAVPRTI